MSEKTNATQKQVEFIRRLIIAVGAKKPRAELPHAPTPEQLAAIPGDGHAKIRGWAGALTRAQASEVIDWLQS